MTDQAHALQIAERLIQLRKKHQLSQEGLADQLGVSRQAVSKWETGQTLPETEKLIRLADLYQVSLDDLLKKETQAQAYETHETDETDEDDEWLAVKPEETTPIASTSKKQEKNVKKRELEEEIVYGLATLVFLAYGFLTGMWYIAWIVFPMAYFVTLIFDYRRV